MTSVARERFPTQRATGPPRYCPQSVAAPRWLDPALHPDAGASLGRAIWLMTQQAPSGPPPPSSDRWWAGGRWEIASAPIIGRRPPGAAGGPAGAAEDRGRVGPQHGGAGDRLLRRRLSADLQRQLRALARGASPRGARAPRRRGLAGDLARTAGTVRRSRRDGSGPIVDRPAVRSGPRRSADRSVLPGQLQPAPRRERASPGDLQHRRRDDRTGLDRAPSGGRDRATSVVVRAGP